MIRKDPRSNLPPGFRFHPTDEELILHYLRKKVSSSPIPLSIIADVDIYKSDPWDLPAKAPFGEKEWYFFSPRDRKYPNGARPNRAAASGYWKATGTDKLIGVTNEQGCNENIGIKKALVFYKGKPPKGVKTNWIMHEYRLAQSLSPKRLNNLRESKEYSMRLDDWVLCRIYKKSHGLVNQEQEPLVESGTILQKEHKSSSSSSCSFSNLLDSTDLSFLTNFTNDQESDFDFMLSNFPSLEDNFLDQKLPQLSSPTSDISGNKRERLEFEEETMNTTTSKKMMKNTLSYDNSVDQFLNQDHLLMSSYLQYQGSRGY